MTVVCSLGSGVRPVCLLCYHLADTLGSSGPYCSSETSECTLVFVFYLFAMLVYPHIHPCGSLESLFKCHLFRRPFPGHSNFPSFRSYKPRHNTFFSFSSLLYFPLRIITMSHIQYFIMFAATPPLECHVREGRDFCVYCCYGAWHVSALNKCLLKG